MKAFVAAMVLLAGMAVMAQEPAAPEKVGKIIHITILPNGKMVGRIVYVAPASSPVAASEVRVLNDAEVRQLLSSQGADPAKLVKVGQAVRTMKSPKKPQ